MAPPLAFVVGLALVAYGLLRYAAVSQVDRALHEQTEAIVHAIRAAEAFNPLAPDAAISATLSSFANTTVPSASRSEREPRAHEPGRAQRSA